MKKNTSIYIHIPFCKKRCSYCDFNTFAGINHLIPKYVDALIQEIRCYGDIYKNEITVGTIFLGGGTPSLLKTEELKQIIDEIKQVFDLLPNAEISLEANPGTVTLSSLKDIRNIGFNRLSLGVQTTQQRHFDLMERVHNYSDAITAYKNARQAGFENINLDLIYGLPDQSLEDWKDTLKLVLDLKPQHFSLYALGIEESTPLNEWVNRGLIALPDDDLAATMYEYASNLLEIFGYKAYEISNFRLIDSKNDWRCQHNLQYWRNLPYLGLGAGAHGYINGKRSENVCLVNEYISLMANNIFGDQQISPALKVLNSIDKYTEMQETMMVGLRLVEEGISTQKFEERFGLAPKVVFLKEIEELISKELLIANHSGICLSEKGILLGNLVFQKFVN